MKRLLLLAAALLLLPSTHAAAAGKRDKKDRTTTERHQPTRYEKLFSNKNPLSAEGGLITLRMADAKLYAELPLRLMGRDLLLGATIGTSSDSELCHPGQRTHAPRLVHLCVEDTTVVLRQTEAAAQFDRTNSHTQALVRDNFQAPALAVWPVLAFTPDSTAVVVDITKLFTDPSAADDPLPEQKGDRSLSFSPDRKATAITGFKVFGDNLTVETRLCGKYKLVVKGERPAPDGEFTVRVKHSLLLLPEEPMLPRRSDLRVGTFLTPKTLLSEQGEQIERRTLARRWRLMPRDTAAYLAGRGSEPVEQIVFYLDPLFPESWKAPIREGVLRWNRAFEAIGFRNAVQVRDFPADDPQFDPDNLSYSCIRYVPTPTQNAMGPSWSDPRTGEIVAASVFIYNDIARLITDWRFVQTAAVDPSVRTGTLPADRFAEALAYVATHEVGHCLGLMHNMGASAAYPVDSLRSASFTRQYGTTPSVMDYARFNYVAQPGDRGVRLTPPELGPYDYYAIGWLYTWHADNDQTASEELADRAQADPMLHYGRQQIASRYDPTALEEDLGDDAIRASDYGIANLRRILSDMGAWLQAAPSDSPERQEQLYTALVQQYARYVRNVMHNVGGIYLCDPGTRSDSVRFESVPREIQQRSARWAIGQLAGGSWIDNPELLRTSRLQMRPSSRIARSISDLLHGLSTRIALSAALSADPYTLDDYLDDLYTLLWEPYTGEQPLNENVRIFQAAMPGIFATATKPAGGNPLAAQEPLPRLLERYYAPDRQEALCYGLDRTCTCSDHDPLSLGAGYGWQQTVSTHAIDEIPSCYYRFACRVEQLIEQRMPRIADKERSHYEAILFALDRITANN